MAALTDTQLSEDVIGPFNAVMLEMPGYTARLWTGVGDLQMLGQTFQGVGDLGGISGIESATSTISPRVTLEMSGLDPVYLDEVSDYVIQDSPVWVWFGLLNRETGQLLADPRLEFYGVIDQPKIKIDRELLVTLECVGGAEHAMRINPGRRNPAHHEAIWPGDKFYQYVGDSRLQQPWGDKDAHDPRTIRGGTTGGGGGRGGRGGGGFSGPNTVFQ